MITASVLNIYCKTGLRLPRSTAGSTSMCRARKSPNWVSLDSQPYGEAFQDFTSERKGPGK